MYGLGAKAQAIPAGIRLVQKVGFVVNCMNVKSNMENKAKNTPVQRRNILILGDIVILVICTY